MNETELKVNGKIYRLTDTNNGNKYSRAKKRVEREGGANEQILAYYDKVQGNIQDESGNKIENGLFWLAEKQRIERKQKYDKVLGNVWSVSKHPIIARVVASSVLFLIAVALGYLFGVDVARFF